MVGQTMQHVAYYRVSTDRQGESGLGLEAQRAAVAKFIGGASLLAEFQEIESGKKHINRPQLTAAIDLCRAQGAKLVIAKLDRLARNVHFVSGLMESRVEFVAADMPEAIPLFIHVMAAFAEHERKAISERTIAALEVAKARGTKLGNPRWQPSLLRARAARNPVAPAAQVVELIQAQREEGKTLRAIALHLNSLGLTTPRGKQWYASTIRNIFNRTHLESQ